MANETKTFNKDIHEKSVNATILFRKKMLNKQPEVLEYLKTLNRLTVTDLESDEGIQLLQDVEVFETGIAEGFGFELDKEIDSNKRFLDAAKLTRFKRGVEIGEKIERVKELRNQEMEKLRKKSKKKQNPVKEVDPQITAAASPIKKLSSKPKKAKAPAEPAAPEDVTFTIKA